MEKKRSGEMLEMYKPDVERLVRFLPWLQEKTGMDVAKEYQVEKEQRTLSFPVYDSMLLNFIRVAETTVFMDRNYRYIYSRYHIRDWEDECKCIESADIMTMDIIGGILSRYVLGGKTKACLWKDAMDYHIFFKAVERARAIVEFWDVPISDRPKKEALLTAGSTDRL